MTGDAKQAETSSGGGSLSLLPEPDMNLRVRPAQFARMMSVSRQTVSRWIQDGKVSLGPDGKLNPKKAAEQVVNHTDPARLRARTLKPFVEDVGLLRQQLQEMTADRDAWKRTAEELDTELQAKETGLALQQEYIAWLEQFAPTDEEDEDADDGE